MAFYGYRLFSFRIAPGPSGRTPRNLKDCQGEPYLEVALRAMKALSQDTMIGDPPSKPEEVAITAGAAALALGVNYANEPAFRVEELQVVENTIRATVMSGKFGSHGKALSAEGPSADADISDMAPAKSFRLVLALPRDGKTGILAVEDISRSTPVTPLTKWLFWRSQQEVEEYRAQGETGRLAWRPMVKPLTDEERLIKLVREGKAHALELVKHSISAASTRPQKRYKVLAPVLDENMAERVVGVLKGWMETSASEDELTGEMAKPVITDAQAAKQLAAIVGPEILDLNPDEGYVVLQEDDESSKTRKISPTQMSDIFTYGQPGGQKSDTPKFYGQVRKTAMRLQAAANIAVDWPEQ